MKKYVFNLMQFGCVAFLLSCVAFPAHAFNFLLFSNYKSTFQAYYGLEGVESTQDLLTAPSICSIDEAYKIKANDLQGYRFKGWFTKKAGWGTNDATADSVDATPFVSTPEIAGAQINSADVGTSSLSGLKTIVAKYVRLYDIGTAVDPADAGSVSGAETYEEGGSATLEAKPNAGWAFWYWKEDNNMSNPRTISNISADATYTAVFKPLFKTVTLDPCGGNGGTTSVVVTNDLALPKITVPTKAGHAFKGYFTTASGDGSTQYYTSSGTSAKNWSAGETATSLFAHWEAKTFTVRFDNDGATSGPEPITVTYGTDPGPLTVVPAKADYKFAGYYLGGACYWDAGGKWVGGSAWTYVPASGDVVILTAHYTAAPYVIYFDANADDATGSCGDLTVTADEEFVLPDGKGLVRNKYRVVGWALGKGGTKAYDIGASTTVRANNDYAEHTPKNQLTFYAVWTNGYQVAFSGNGGTGEMKAQSMTYDVEAKLTSNGFVRDGFVFNGWATDPTDDAVYADNAMVTNLIEGLGDVVLYAKWKQGEVGGNKELCEALDCSNVGFEADEAKASQFSVVSDSSAKGGTCVKINVEQLVVKPSAAIDYILQGSVAVGGRLTFSYKTSIYDDLDTPSKLKLITPGIGEDNWLERTNDWVALTYQIGSAGAIGWDLQRQPQDGYDFKSSNDDYVLIDNVIWEPAVTNELTVGVTFRSNDGTSAPRDIVTNATKTAGKPFGELPVLADKEDGREFLGWALAADSTSVVTPDWTVPDAIDGTQLYAVWSKVVDPDPPTPVVTNAVPVAVTGLVYDGTAKTGVAEGANYTIVGNVGTNAGDYVAVATVTNGVWDGGATGATNIAWTIAKAPAPDVSGVTFSGATYEYDGTERTIAVSGTVPAGVAVVYSGDPTNRTEVGTNTVTASFRVLDAANYEAITTTLTAKLIVTAKEEPPPPPPPGPESGRLYADSEVGEFRTDAAATYNGWLRQGDTIVAAIQVKTSKASKSKPAKASLTVTPLGGKKKTYKSDIVASADGEYVDDYGVHYGDVALTGTVSGFVDVPAGATIEAAKDFSKSKVQTEKDRMSGIPVGCRTLALPTADGYDCLSVTIAKKTGKASVKGTLDDGTSVSLSVQGALGSKSFAVPVVYSKTITSKATGVRSTVTFSFVLWISLADGEAWITDETGGRWIGEQRFVSQAKTVVRPVDGTYGIRFNTPEGYLMTSDDGVALAPNGVHVDVAGRKWNADKSVGSVKYDKNAGVIVKVSKGKTPANVSKFKLSYTEKTGVVKGSFKLYYQPTPTKVKTESVTVTGIAVDGMFYGNAVIKKKGLYSIWWERVE